jgi:D-methionine transport system ATP-binding protein
MIEIQGLNKNYESRGGKIFALREVNIQVKRGEVFGVIGKSGAGKSTLIRCVNLLEKPTSGKIIIDGIDLTNLSAAKLRATRRQIGMIFQHFNLLESRTVYENIALPLELAKENKIKIRKKVEALLELVNLQDRAEHYPVNLSGGQKQRAAIARALVTNSKVLLCDEPTSALDPESSIAIQELLGKINRELGVTIFIITHQMEVIKNICDRVAILENGLVVEQGNVIDVFAEPKTAAAKKMLQSYLHLELPEYLRQGGTIIRLVFIGKHANEPIVANLLERFKVTVNILQADLEQVHGATMGFMLCKFSGTTSGIAQAIEYLKELNIKLEVINYE